MPALNIFETSFRRGKFDASRKLANGGMMDFTHIYPMDAVFDTPEDVPEEVCAGVCACVLFEGVWLLFAAQPGWRVSRRAARG